MPQDNDNLPMPDDNRKPEQTTWGVAILYCVVAVLMAAGFTYLLTKLEGLGA